MTSDCDENLASQKPEDGEDRQCTRWKRERAGELGAGGWHRILDIENKLKGVEPRDTGGCSRVRPSTA